MERVMVWSVKEHETRKLFCPQGTNHFLTTPTLRNPFVDPNHFDSIDSVRFQDLQLFTKPEETQ